MNRQEDGTQTSYGKTETLTSRGYDKNNVKVAGSLGCILLVIVNIFVLLNPARGYELSFYDGMPLFVWYFLLIASFCGVYIAFYEVYTKHCYASNTWIYGLFIVLLSRISFLLIPCNRDYIGWKGDHLTHVGFIRDIFISANISVDNFYPITHVIIASTSMISNISPNTVVMCSTALLSVFFVLSYYLLGTYFFRDKRIVILTVVSLGCVFLSDYDLFLRPNGWAVLLLPFTLYLLLRAIEPHNGNAFLLLSATVIILVPFMHLYNGMIIAIFLVMCIIFNLSVLLFNTLKNTPVERSTFRGSAIFILLILLSITSSYWLLMFQNFHNHINRLFDAILLSGSGRDYFGSIGASAGKLQLNILDFISLVIKMEGAKIVILLLFFLAVYIFCHNPGLVHKHRIGVFITFIIATFFFGFGYFLFIFGIPGLDAVAGERFLRYAVVFAALLGGISYLHISSYKNIFGIVICFLLVIFVFYISIFGLVQSPNIQRPTPQVTLMEMEGMEWSFMHKDTTIEYIGIMSPPFRYADAILGVDERKRRGDIKRYIDAVPNHFNYEDSTYFGSNMDSDRYLVLTEYDEIIYQTVWKTVGRFNYNDFVRLKKDESVSLLYSNGECDVYFINSQFKTPSFS